MADPSRPVSKVRQARLDAGLLLVEAAAKAELSIGYLSMIENGYLPKAKVRQRVAKALGTKPGRLWELDA